MKKILKNLFLSTVLLGLVSSLTLLGVFTYFSLSLPKISGLADYRPNVSSKILSRDGTVLAEIAKERREVIDFDDIPKVIVDCFLSAEDDNFYEHTGVDYLGVMRAAIVNLKAGRVVQGGSTITQQVAKTFLLGQERSFSRKIKDFLLAQRIEKKFSKKEILHLYLNQVYLGGGHYGVKAAFKGYFEKNLEEVTLAEAAMVAGLLVAPSKYSPYRNPVFAKKRQSYVLKRMLDTGKAGKDEYDSALEEKIRYRLRKAYPFKAGHFTDWVRQRVSQLVGEKQLLTQGYTVKTTLDWGLQDAAEKAVLKGVKNIDKRQGFKKVVENFSEDYQIGEYETKMRKAMYKKHANFFILTDDLEKEFEIQFDEIRYSSLKTAYLEKEEEFKKEKKGKYPVGLIEEDPFYKYLRKGDTFKAVVTFVDNRSRTVFVNLGGVPGVITYSGFRWAHEREISDKRQFFPYVLKPSTILKKGDVVSVNILRKKSPLRKLVYKDFLKKKRNEESLKEYTKESYLK
ncbi:hypothetical protein HON22_01155, partial [Candidatus Peregrinibacteria bacterium]|nr:hypothetical protein [Candidatus Peregrinibacteria bacterium]